LGDLDGLGDVVGCIEGSIEVDGVIDKVGWTVVKADVGRAVEGGIVSRG
jgi:hypothetical protein